MEFTKEELANEEWRDVVGYEGLYQVSSLGRVFSLKRQKMMKFYKKIYQMITKIQMIQKIQKLQNFVLMKVLSKMVR
mgnify:CR=1 FL=1